MNVRQLKNALLQQAIEGRLVPQNPDDEPAAVLLQRIRAEKARLIEEGRIKKQKPLPPITDEEKPFPIPASWEWVRLGECCNICSASRVHQADWKTSGIPFYRAREIGVLSEYGYVNNELFISEELFAKLSSVGLPQKGDLMVTAVGTLGKVYIVKEDDRFYYKDASVICLQNFSKINSLYIKRMFESNFFKNIILSYSSGTTVGTITIANANRYLLPLPPLEEQKRIVAKLEEILPEVEEYGRAQEELNALEAALPGRLRKSLLQEAVEGRLVPQNPDDEPAAVLLQRIRAEKARLIKEGKIKKQKPLPPITDEEKPFPIPASWEWVRLGEITYNHGQEKPSEDFIYIDVSSVNGETGTLKDNLLVVAKDNAPSRARKIVLNGDILYATIRPYLRNICILNMESERKIIASTAFCILCCGEYMLNSFLFYFLRSNRHINIVKNKMVGVAYPAIAENIFLQTPVPLPPLEEQKRIVAKLEEVLPLCAWGEGATSEPPAGQGDPPVAEGE